MRARFDDDVYSPITLYYEGTNSRGDVSIACSPGNNKAKSKFLEYAGDLLSKSL